MRVLRRLGRCTRGAAMLEFALLAPVFLMALFGVIEGSRLVWTQQTISEVAYATARCMSVSANCDTLAEQSSFAVARASSYGITVTAANVTPQGGVDCNGFANSNQVTVTENFDSVLNGFVPNFPATVSASSCFPVLS